LRDKEPVEKTSQGDLAAFRAIVDEHKKNVFRLAFDMTGNRHDAEDISQEVFLKAYRSLGQFRGESKMSTWLYRVTVNACYDHRSKKAWTSMKPTDRFEENDRSPLFHEHASNNPQATAESRVIQGHIDRALDKLTARERSVFVMRHYSDLSMKEIAMVLKISEGTVKSMLFRALKRLQQELHFYRSDLGLEEAR
jgi:RNA polymerase sigma-70 factor (ECF subfamily)